MVDNLKNYLLKELPFINVGVVGVYQDVITGKILSYENDEVGISDKDGNSFYIRENGDESYRVIQQNAPKTVERNRNFKLVLFCKKLNIESVKDCVLNSLFNYKINGANVLNVTSSTVNIGKIVNEEYPRVKDKSEIMKRLEQGSLLAVWFNLSEKKYENYCKCEITERC